MSEAESYTMQHFQPILEREIIFKSRCRKLVDITYRACYTTGDPHKVKQ